MNDNGHSWSVKEWAIAATLALISGVAIFVAYQVHSRDFENAAIKNMDRLEREIEKNKNELDEVKRSIGIVRNTTTRMDTTLKHVDEDLGEIKTTLNELNNALRGPIKDPRPRN